jgi:signal transduction histidine kinase
MARRALKPLRVIDARLQEIQATDLARRIDVYPADRELASLVTTLNGLLDRLDRSFLSLRQFAADVSHQLQTPLTVMKSALDHARRSPASTAAEQLQVTSDTSCGAMCSAMAARYVRIAVSRAAASSKPGRRTLTTTVRPSGSVARCTWAIVAAASPLETISLGEMLAM